MTQTISDPTPTQSSTPTPPHTAEHHPRLPLIFTALMLAMLLSSLGQTVFSAALPTIVGELGGVDHMTWVITAYLLGETISLPLFGKLGDQIGRKGLFLGTLTGFGGFPARRPGHVHDGTDCRPRDSGYFRWRHDDPLAGHHG